MAACRHCGLPLAHTPRDPEDAWCCSGCWVAAHLAGSGDDGRQPDQLKARLVLSAFLSMGVMVFTLSLYGESWGKSVGAEMGGEAAGAMRGLFRLGALALTAPVVFLLGLPLARAVVRMRRWLSAEGLVVAGVSAALCVSLWNVATNAGEVYFETISMVLVLVTLGRWLESSAKVRARERLGALLPDRVEAVARLDADGREEAVDPERLLPGERLRVRPGEVLAVDGTVLAGRAFVDTSSLSGEEEPRPVGPGDRVLAGTTPTDGALEVRVEAIGRDRVRERVEALLEEALSSRGVSSRLADRAASALIPIVLVLAVATAISRWASAGPEKALLDALSVVLISCPCALGIATPLAFWLAMGAAWRQGALVRGAEVLEALARSRRVLLDKTGTLTTGELELEEFRVLEGAGWDAAGVLRAAAALESSSEHPVGRALCAAHGAREEGPPPAALDFRVRPGVGVEGTVEGRALALVRGAGDADDPRTRVVLREPGEAGEAVAEFFLTGHLRPEARDVVEELRAQGLQPAVLTGDGPGPAARVARELSVPVEAELSPADKLARVRAAGAGTLFVGDGLNDGAALAAAEVGVSVAGGVGRSLERASVNLLRPGLEALAGLVPLARRAVGVARWNLVWAFLYNVVGLGLAASGRLTPVFAASAMVASSVVVVLHSRRAVSVPSDS